MLPFLVISYFLSALGALAYLGYFRSRLSPLHRKHFLLGVVALSLVLPIFSEAPDWFVSVKVDDYSDAIERFTTQLNVVDYSDVNLQNCYEKARMEGKDMCSCEVEQKANMVVFQPDERIANWLAISKWVVTFFGIISFLFFIDFLVKVLSLYVFTKRTPMLKGQIEGTECYFLYPQKPFPVSSFSLYHYYVVWPTHLDSLSEAERNAVLHHELAHLKNRDTLLLIGLHLLKAIWWLNPIFYMIRNELHLQCEMLADTHAARKSGDARAYAALLVRMKEAQTLLPVHSFGESFLRQRVVHLLQPEQEPRSGRLRLGLLAVGTVFWGVTVFAIPLLESQLKTLREYEWLQHQQAMTGKTIFCKSCLINDLEKGPSN